MLGAEHTIFHILFRNPCKDFIADSQPENLFEFREGDCTRMLVVWLKIDLMFSPRQYLSDTAAGGGRRAI
jgi:hypothetical protein